MSRQLSVMSDVSCKTCVTSTVSQEWTRACHHRQWRVHEPLQRKMAFKRLVTWCFLKNKALWNSINTFEDKVLGWMINEILEGWKYSDFLPLRLFGGKYCTVQNTDCNYLSPRHRYNTLVKKLPNRQCTPIPFRNQMVNHRIDFSSDKRRQQKFLR